MNDEDNSVVNYCTYSEKHVLFADYAALFAQAPPHNHPILWEIIISLPPSG